jgi:hypothetical protein
MMENVTGLASRFKPLYDLLNSAIPQAGYQSHLKREALPGGALRLMNSTTQTTMQKADRNAISARGQAQMQPGQLTALANTVSATFKEVSPGSVFTVRRDVPIDGGHAHCAHLPPPLPQNFCGSIPSSSARGQRLKQCYLTGDPSSRRELLVPGDAMWRSRCSSLEIPRRPRTWDSTYSTNRSLMPELNTLGRGTGAKA